MTFFEHQNNYLLNVEYEYTFSKLLRHNFEKFAIQFAKNDIFTYFVNHQ